MERIAAAHRRRTLRLHRDPEGTAKHCSYKLNLGETSTEPKPRPRIASNESGINILLSNESAL